MSDSPSEDVRKLHAEVNQIINQRYLLTTLAVTIFGGVTVWLIPRQGPATAGSGTDAGTLYLIGPLLLILLGLFYTVSHTLKVPMRTITTYLEVFKLSDWEKHWKKYREDGYIAYTSIQTWFFLALGFLVMVVSLSSDT